ncbi:hypothetical protein A2U01_0110699, partial [Trifolium medium]|nr:hypothetical protein [Trifolium medium]
MARGKPPWSPSRPSGSTPPNQQPPQRPNPPPLLPTPPRNPRFRQLSEAELADRRDRG